MTRLSEVLSAALVVSAVSVPASATSIHISAPVVCSYGACDGTPEHDYGTLTIDLEATGLPASGYTVASVSDVNATLALDDGQKFVGTGGSGQVMSDTSRADILNFSAGQFWAYLDVPVGWDGTGALPSDDGENSSLISFGDANYYLNGGMSSSAAAPEPESITLMLSGLSASGAALWGRRRLRGSVQAS